MIRFKPIAAVLVFLAAIAAGGETPDIEYGVAGGESLRLDASVPPGAGPFPIAILIHGGGWGSGDKRGDFDALAKPLAEAGFARFSIDYRLAPKHPWPACFDDVQTALRWVRAHAAEFHCDPHRVALIGYSAGGQLAALAAIRAETGVQAVVGLAPAVDLVADTKRRGEVSPSLQNLLGLPAKLDDRALAAIAAISPAGEIRAGLPPFLLLQGTADQSVRHEETAAFVGKLREAGVACQLIDLPNAPHRIADWPKFHPTYPAETAAWLAAVPALGKPAH